MGVAVGCSGIAVDLIDGHAAPCGYAAGGAHEHDEQASADQRRDPAFRPRLVFIEMNRSCDVSMTPNTSSTSVPPT